MPAAAPAFTAQTLTFLRALKRHNTREWFHERRARYDAHVHAPMLAIVERLAVDLPRVAPGFHASPKLSMFRPWRDTRFSANKAPLETPAADVIRHKQFIAAREEAPEFAVRPDFYSELLATLKAMAPFVAFLNEPILERRRAIERDPLAAQLSPARGRRP